MAPKNSGPVEDFPEGQDQMAELREPGSSARAAARQPSPAEAPPRVEIVEQPAEESRFRYSRESRTNGSLLGVNSTESHKTYPSIRVNCVGLVRIRVSCVSKDRPYRPHPHKIVGRENCVNGVFTRQEHIRRPDQVIRLRNIGVQCTKREEIASSLQERALLGVDPLGTGYDITGTSTLLHYLRLAIEVFVPDQFGQWKLYGVAVTDVITDLPTKLRIFHLSHKHGSVYGGTQLTLLTSKLPNQERLVIRFSQDARWCVNVRPHRVHHQFGLVVFTPPYMNGNISTAVPVTVQLVRPPSGDPDVDRHAVGEPCDFLYTPGPDYDPVMAQAPKRQRTDQKTLHPSLQPQQGDSILADSPPEPQLGSPTNLNIFAELDQWFAEQVQQASQLRHKQNSNQTQRDLNPFCRSTTTACQTENNQDKANITTSHNFCQPSTSRQENSILQQPNRRLTYESHLKSDVFQHHNIPNTSNGDGQRESSLKRNHSQMEEQELNLGNNGPINTTLPPQSQTPNSLAPLPTPSTSSVQSFPVFPDNQMFFEIPPDMPGNSRSDFSPPIASIVPSANRNSHPVLTPQIAGCSRSVTAVRNSIPEGTLVDLTGPSDGKLAYQLSSDDLRYFEGVPERRTSSWEDILNSSLDDWTPQQPGTSEGEASVDSNVSLVFSPGDIEIISLSDELTDILNFIEPDENVPNV